MEPVTGFEPATERLEISCSFQLSYTGVSTVDVETPQSVLHSDTLLVIELEIVVGVEPTDTSFADWLLNHLDTLS